MIFEKIKGGEMRESKALGFFKTNNGVIITGRAFTGSTTDTTEVLALKDHGTIFVTVQTQDSATVIIAYALSNDGTNFTAFTTKDSLSNSTTGNGVKSVDFSATTLGGSYVKFRFTFSAAAFAVGTTSATYNASWILKKPTRADFNAVISAIDSQNVALYGAQSGGVRDSIVITRSTPNTTYTIGDMYGTSLTAASNTFFKLTNSTLLAGRIGYVEKVIGAADSGYTNVIIRVHFMSDTTGHTAFADNAAFAIDGTYSSIIGYADLSFDGQGTVSTVYSKAVNSTLHLSYTASPLYAFVTMLTGSTLKNGGKFTIYVEYLKP